MKFRKTGYRYRFRFGYKITRVGAFLRGIFIKFINFIKLITKRIYIWITLRRLNKNLSRLEKLRFACFQNMGERIYELKKDTSFELIDLASVNGEINNVREIDNKIKEIKVRLKEVKGGKIEGLSSWWSRRGSNP